MPIIELSKPVYRLDCDRKQCSSTIQPYDEKRHDPDAIKRVALAQGWQYWYERDRRGAELSDPLLLCSHHAHPPLDPWPGGHYEPRAEPRVAHGHGLESVGAWRHSSWTKYEKCRKILPGRVTCGRAGYVEQLKRHGAHVRWWTFCSDHAGGRWIEGDDVMRWELISDAGE